jgi:hypothetical protein
MGMARKYIWYIQYGVGIGIRGGWVHWRYSKKS